MVSDSLGRGIARRLTLGLALLAATLGLAGAPGAARADEVTPEVSTDGRIVRDDAWQGALGIRGSVIHSRGLDPFATDDAVPQLSLTLLRRVARLPPRLALMAGVGVDVGSSDAPARSIKTELDLTRVSAVVQLQSQVHWRVQVFARLAPGYLRTSATLTDASTPWSLQTSYGVFSVDGSVGAGVRLNDPANSVGFVLVGDAGYGWAQSHEMVFKLGLSGRDAAQAGDLRLEPLAARGAFFRGAVAATF